MGGSPQESAAGWIGQAGKAGNEEEEEEDDAGGAADGYGFGSGGGAGGTVAAAEAGDVATVSVGEQECSGKTGCSDGSLAERS